MARNKRSIEKALTDDILAISPDVDVYKGPILDLFIRPQAAQIRLTETQVDDLSKRYSLDYIRTQKTEALLLYGANHGVRKSPGRPARGSVHFYTYSRLRAGEVLVIPAGTVVTTSDTTIAYQTTREVIINGETIESYYSATRRRYEVQAPVESLGTGEVFDIPAFRIRNIQGSIAGVDGVENRVKIQGGTAAESNESYGRKILMKFNGTALGSGDGLRQLIQNYDSSRILDTKLVFSSDYTLFRRRTRRAAWDVYLIGEDEESVVDNFTGDGVRNEFVLTYQPTLSVSDVKVNGVSVQFSYKPDTTDQTKQSSSSRDSIILPAAPSSGMPVQITYSYDKLIQDVQDYVDQIQINLYEADTLIRKAIPIYLRVKVTVQILSSYDESSTESDVRDVISEFANITNYVDILYPEKLRDSISSEVGGISKVTIVEFTRRDYGTMPIEAVEFAGNEYPVLLADDVTVTVRR